MPLSTQRLVKVLAVVYLQLVIIPLLYCSSYSSTPDKPISIGSDLCNYTAIDVSCFGEDDGSIAFNPMGGTAPYSYQWSHDASFVGSFAQNLEPGDYMITVSDSGACQEVCSVTILEPDPIIINDVIEVNPTCGATNGELIIDASNADGSTTGLMYSINNGLSFQTSNSFSDLPAQDYLVIVANESNCTVKESPQLSNSVNLELTYDALCKDNGLFDVTVQLLNGTSPYIYQWSFNGSSISTAPTLIDIVPGTYTLEVEDFVGCDVSITFETGICCNTMAYCNFTAQDESCFGYNDGSITMNPQGGIPPYSYIWSHDASITGATATGLAPAEYSVQVLDSQGCETTCLATINPAAELDALELVTTDPSCGLANGSVVVNASIGGSSVGIQYSDNNGASFQNSNVFNGLSEGPLSITISYGNNCMANVTGELFPSQGIDLDYELLCHDNGLFDITGLVIDGVDPISYEWFDNAGNSLGTDQMLIGVAADTYTLFVNDSRGCIKDLTITTGNCCRTQDFCNYSTTDETCFEANDGNIVLLPMGGSEPYSFAWSHDAALNNNIADNLEPGNYSVTITDADDCLDSCFIEILAADVLEITAINTSNTSCGNTNGTIEIEINLNTIDPLSVLYSIDGGLNFTPNNEFENLGSGEYQIIVAYNQVCELGPELVMIEASEPLQVAYDLNCNDSGLFELTSQILNGMEPFDIEWFDQDMNSLGTSESLTDMPEGNYVLVVTDNAGCTAESDIITGNCCSTQEFCNYTSGDVSCSGGGNGFIVFAPIGGDEPYIYEWSHDSSINTNEANDLNAGLYSVTITDFNNCIDVCQVEILSPSAIEIQGVVITETSCGLENGSITINATADTDMQYSIDDGENFDDTNIFQNLASGNYNIQVSDVAGCTLGTLAYIVSSNIPEISVTQDCNSSNLVDATLEIKNMTEPYDINWLGPNGFTSQNLSEADLEEGTYDITIIDSLGCEAQYSFVTINCCETSAYCNYEILFEDCNNPDLVSIILTPDGGDPPYQVSWSHDPSNNTTIAENMPAGSYNISISDALGCEEVCEITVPNLDPTPIALNLEEFIEVSFQDTVNLTATVNRDAAEIQDVFWEAEMELDCDDCLNPSFIAYNNTELIVTVVDINGCQTSRSITILVNSEFETYIPIIFNPTIDLPNNTFTVYGNAEELININFLRVYDRFGNLVFQSFNIPANLPEMGWDGTIQNKRAESGVYTYFTEVEFIDGTVTEYIGSITVVY